MNASRPCPEIIDSHAEVKDLIVNHVSKHVSKHPTDSIRMLSLSTGSYAEDLSLFAKLAEAKIGLPPIHLALVDLSFDECAYCDLIYYIERMEKAYGISISISGFVSAAEIDPDEEFDVVYAIDYEDRGPHFGHPKELPGRAEFFTRKPYRAVTDLIKAANLATSANALVIMSHGKDIISLTPNTAKSQLTELKSLFQLSCDLEVFDFFYLNAGISNVLFNLECLAHLKKLLFINEDIVLKKDRGDVAAFLKHLGIAHEFINDASIVSRLEKEPQDKKCLVVDYTIFDETKREAPVPQIYQSPNFSIVRIDGAKSNILHDWCVAIYPSPENPLSEDSADSSK